MNTQKRRPIYIYIYIERERERERVCLSRAILHRVPSTANLQKAFKFRVQEEVFKRMMQALISACLSQSLVKCAMLTRSVTRTLLQSNATHIATEQCDTHYYRAKLWKVCHVDSPPLDYALD